MIKLHPIPEADFNCPACSARLQPVGWYMPGMRPLARLHCDSCGRDYYGDLAAAQGIYTPMLLDAGTGVVHDRYGVPWFANWLANAYRLRGSAPIGITEEIRRPLGRPLLLNCLDRLYGHALLKLLNAQYYLDHRSEYDLVALVPRYLRWLVPDGVAAIWTIDLPLSQGTEWNDHVAEWIAARVSAFDNGMLGVALPHPHPADISIERFSRVAPCSEAEWERVGEAPVVSFIWREDRMWAGERSLRKTLSRRLAPSRTVGAMRSRQQHRLVRLATALRAEFPAISFNVIGIGRAGRLPGWMNDERTRTIDEERERTWCRLYAASHVVTGIHGSNMLLPSAHAGAVVELMPADRWGNYLQDLVPAYADPREAMIHNRVVPDTIAPEAVAGIIASVLRERNGMMLNLGRAVSLHAEADIRDIARRRLLLRSDQLRAEVSHADASGAGQGDVEDGE